jgi:hypothetical protein
MSNQAPGVNIIVNAAPSPTTPSNTTGQWFVLGVAAGPAGVVVPVNSINDFINAFGSIQNGALTGRYTLSEYVDSTLLYDALDVYFREGGATAFVSRVNAAESVVAATSAEANAFILTASGGGTWANSSSASATGLILTIAASTVNSTTVYTATLAYNGVPVAAPSQNLLTNADVVNYVNSLSPAFCTAALQDQTSALPTTGDSISIYFTGGTDLAVQDSDIAAALVPFDILYGPGQVSYPGNTDATVYSSLTEHAQAFNRVAYLDGANTPTAATIESAVTALQVTDGVDPSYAGVFAPWVVVPGVVNSNPSLPVAPVFNRTVAPCALAAAKAALNDASHDCNVPAAGPDYAATYAIGLSQTYSAADRGNLNAGGVNVIKIVPNVNDISIYGFRSAAFDPNWVYLNNIRFRMQMVRDVDILAEGYAFDEIDGQGQLIAAFNGSLGGLLLAYWNRKSLYGTTAAEAFSINTGPTVNTPATIAANQLNANLSVKMSPFAEQITVTITKYLANATLPA